jgi:ATP-dependent Zn protease
MTGADIAAIALAAAGLTLADGQEELDQSHLDEALERRGLVRRRPVRDALERREAAIHEAGHAVFAWVVLGRQALNEVAIARDGRGEGHVNLTSEWNEETGWRSRQWRQEVQFSLAGIIAEELIVPGGMPSFGSEYDIAGATDIILRAHAAGLVPSFGRVSTERVERGAEADPYDLRGSEGMRMALWTSIKAEMAEAEMVSRAILAEHVAPITRLAALLEAAGTLSGARLADALVDSGAPERAQ